MGQTLRKTLTLHELTVAAGTYTVIVSTFEPGATAAYTLNVESSSPVSLESVPAEGAGMFSRTINGAWSVSPLCPRAFA